jgi:translocation and assembly module TamB
LDTGSFELKGEINHEYFKPIKMNLDFTGNNLPVEIPDTLSLLLNSRIQITGENGKGEAKGEIVMVNGSYYRDVNINLLLLETIGKRSRSVSTPSKPLELPFFKEIDLDIDVSHREPFLVQNNLSEMEIASDLTIGGTLSQPVINGRADVTDGVITFKKKTFTIKKGVIDFVNPYKTEMSIDIESIATIRDWDITLTLKGTPNNLDLSLSSDPSESDADILSLLVFGKTSTELTNGETENQTSTRELLTNILAETLAEELKDATDMIDILELETGDEDDEDDEDTDSDRVKVTMGKHLSDRMTVKVAVESKDGEMVQRAISEYKFLEHILLSGFQDTQGIFGGELVFRIEFR